MNGLTDQGETSQAGRPRPWPHCVRWGPSSPSPKRRSPTQIFGPCLSWPNGCMDKDGTWHASAQGTLCSMGTQPILPKKATEPPRQFSAHVYCGQTAGWIKMPLGMEVGLGPGDFVFDGDPATPRAEGTPTNSQLLAHLYCGQTAG